MTFFPQTKSSTCFCLKTIKGEINLLLTNMIHDIHEQSPRFCIENVCGNFIIQSKYWVY